MNDSIMKDYSALTNDDIANDVLLKLGYKIAHEGCSYRIFLSDVGRKDTGITASSKFKFDPCINPADAWPIIVDNGIALFKSWCSDSTISNTTWAATTDLDKSWVGYTEDGYDFSDTNPLRAAMIVYLMMDAKT